MVKSGWGVPAADALRREAAALDLLRHPGVVELVGIDQRGLGPAAVTDLATRLAGVTTLVTAPPSSPAAALTRVGQILATLAAIHARGLAHGAITPTHVVISPTGSARWCGLGRAHSAPVATRLAEVRAAAGLATAHLGTARLSLGRRRWAGRLLGEAALVLGDERLDAAAMAAALAGLLTSLHDRPPGRRTRPDAPVHSAEADGDLVGEQPTGDGQHHLLPPLLDQAVEDSRHIGWRQR